MRPGGLRGSTPTYSATAWQKAQLQALGAGPTGDWLAQLFGFPSAADFYYAASTGSLSPDQSNQIKTQTDAMITQAATDPNTGIVNTALAEQQMAQAHQVIDAALAQAQAQSTGSTVADIWDTLMGTGPSASNLLRNLLGLSPSGPAAVSALNVIADIIIITGAALAAYFGYRFVKEL